MMGVNAPRSPVVCPKCREAGEKRTVWPYDDNHVTCKKGHVQRIGNAVDEVVEEQGSPKRKFRPGEAAGFAALAVVAVDLLVRVI